MKGIKETNQIIINHLIYVCAVLQLPYVALKLINQRN